jgi:hypothetical protein
VNPVNIPALPLRDSRATESGKTTERWTARHTHADRAVLVNKASEQGQLATDHGAAEIYRAGFT